MSDYRLAIVVAWALALAGCNSGGGSSEKAAAGKTAGPLSRARPASGGPTSVMLKAGPPPITFVFSQGGKIRILDETAGRTLVNTTLNPGTIVAIDVKGGVLLGNQKAVAGPLSAEHRYEVWWDAEK